MFDIEACYKVIFEALFEQQGIENIVKKVHEYTDANVYLISMSGEILAYVCDEKEKETSSIIERHLTLYEYDRKGINIKKTEQSIYMEKWGKYYHIAEITVNGAKIGYSILAFKEEFQSVNMEKVNEVLCQAFEIQFRGSTFKRYENIPMRRQICAWTIFSKNIRKEDLEILNKEVTGKYFLIFIPNKEEELGKQRIYQQIQGIWNKSYFDFGENYLCTFFFDVNEKSREIIMSEMKRLGYPMCVSEMFSNLEACSQKKDFLECMDRLDGYWKAAGVMEEKDWYVETVFSYAAPMFKEIGLSDYSIEQLCKEDAEKNLELYDTLKMYFLCENNISVTASKLHVHRNTLVYRLKQIQNCIERNINDSNVSKELLSFMIMFDIVRQNGE